MTLSKLTYSTKFIFTWILLHVLTSCQPVLTEGEYNDVGTFMPTSTSIEYTPFIGENPETDFEDNLILETYTNILHHYYEVITDPNIPIATRMVLEETVSTLEAQVTSISEPYPTYSPPDVDHKATLEIIWELTATTQPTPIPEFGIIRREPYAQTTFPRRDDIWIEDAWLGYINGDTKLRVVRIGSFREGSLDNPTYYGVVHLHGDYMEDILYLTNVPQKNLSLIAVINDQYLIMEALDNNALGTGERYYFDMVAREFMPQPTAELWIENFPGGGGNTLQAVATPTTPPIFSTAVPSGPTLHWNTQHSQDCWASGGWSVPADHRKASGQQSISAQVITTYYLTCFNPIVHTTAWTAPDTGSLMVISDFRANTQAPLFTTPNTPIALQWSASYSSSQNCQASGAWTGTKPRYGSENIASLSIGKHLFTLTCQGETLSVLVVVEETLPTPVPTATPTLPPSPTATPVP